MANLYGSLKGNRGSVTRMGSSVIHSELETWNGSIVTELDSDGTFRVYIGEKKNANTLVAEGNVDNKTVTPEPIPMTLGKGQRV